MNLKMKEPTLCCCFTWVVFIELNFAVAFLLMRKTRDGRFVGGGKGDFGGVAGILVMGGMTLTWFWNGGVDTPLTAYDLNVIDQSVGLFMLFRMISLITKHLSLLYLRLTSNSSIKPINIKQNLLVNTLYLSSSWDFASGKRNQFEYSRRLN